jgi:hypothetical protein
MKRNKKGGYQQLRVWDDALGYYKQPWEVFRKLSFELRRVTSQQIASSDSVHRNIIEEKREYGPWTDHLIVKESNAAYAIE